MTPAESAQAFAAALLGDHGEMCKGLQLTLSTFTSGASGPSTRWLPATADSLASAITLATGGATTLGVYVGVGLTRGPRAIGPAGKFPHRLTKDNVDGLVWLWIDIDIAGGGHADSRMKLCPDMATARKLIASVGLPPTVLVNTGHGLQAHWRLRQPFIYGCVDFDDDGVPVIDDTRIDADRAAGEDLAWSWVKSFQIRGRELGGFHVDPVSDPSRLVRCPGSYNRKVPDDHREVVMLECDASRVYDVEDFTAVLMPEKLLAPLRFNHDVLTGDMAGVDLVALWAQSMAFPEHEPPWLAYIFEQNLAPELEALWRGERDGQYGCDESAIDMGLARALLKWRLSPSDACQAIMCRRLRRCEGKKLDKVNPAHRTTYLEMTVGKVVTAIRAEEAKAQASLAAEEKLGAVLSELTAAPAPVVVDEDPGPDEPLDEGEPPEVDEPGDLTDDAGTTPIRPVLRMVPPVVSESPAAAVPAATWQDDIPSGTPPPTPAQEDAYKGLSAMLGFPQGEVRVIGIEERHMPEVNEMRVWLLRTETDVVCGGKWAPNTRARTRWHPKAGWKDRAKVAGYFESGDLSLFTTVARDWGTSPGGYRLFCRLAQQVDTGTPARLVTWGIVELLRLATGSGKFSTAVSTRDPWVNDGAELWVPLTSVRDSIKRLGHAAPDGVVLEDTLEDLRCLVRAQMAIAEGYRTVHDTAPWVRVPPGLLGDELWAATVERAADRDKADHSSNVRKIPSHE